MRHLVLILLILVALPAYTFADEPPVIRALSDAAVSETTCLAFHLEDGQGRVLCLAIDDAFCRASLVDVAIGTPGQQKNTLTPLSWDDPCMAAGRLPALREALAKTSVPWMPLVRLTRQSVAHVGGAIWSAPGARQVIVEGPDGALTFATWPSLKVLDRWAKDALMTEIQGVWMVPDRGIFVVSRTGINQRPAETLFGWHVFQARAFAPIVKP